MVILKNNSHYFGENLLILFFVTIIISIITAHITFSKSIPPSSNPLLPHFIEIAKSAHIDHPGKSSSATWVDYDEDGFLDLFVCSAYNQKNVFYRNLGDGAFEDIIESTGLVSFLWSICSHWIDVDNNGDLDCYLDNKDVKDQIFKNTGQDSFINISKSLNFQEGGCVAWADYNRDGWLDVYICRGDANRKKAGSPPNLFYRNIGNGRFEEIAAQAGIAGEGDSYFANWVDYNNDGHLDLYVTDGNKQQEHLYRNNGNETFTDIFSSTGISENDGNSFWADFNNDGWMDLFVAEGEQSTLYKNNGDGTLSDITSIAGLAFPPNISADANWVDFDNDGFLDLHFQTYTLPLNKSKTIIYRNNGDETFTEVAQQIGFTKYEDTFSSAWGDYDNDGDLDLYLANRGPNTLYRNEGNDNNRIKINLTGRISNRDAIEARVKVVSGSLIQFRELGIGQGFKSPTRQTLQFGLGQHTIIDSIIIRWPSGVVQDTFQISANQKVVFHEPIPPLFSDVTLISGFGEDINKSMTIAFMDFNNDSNVDIYVANHGSRNLLYRNSGTGQFDDVTLSAGIDYNVSCSGIGYGDFNNDGYGDVYLANAVYSPNLLLQNLGNGTFSDVTKPSGVAGKGICSDDVVLGDFNKDGDLDIYVANQGPNFFYINLGNFAFLDATAQAGVGDSLISCCTAADYDNDGDLDIYIANNRGGYDEYPIKDAWLNRLYRNNGDGTFTDVAQEAGVQDMGNSKGCCFGDYDNDGDLDLYVGNDGGSNKLYQNNGDGSFTNVTEGAGVAEPLGTHGVVFADFDNDGYLDIYAAGGSYIPEQHDYCVNKDHPDKLYHNNGDGTFADITRSSGVEFNKAATAGVAVGDYDNDGDLDVFLANSIYKGYVPSANVLLKNNGNDNHWLHIKLTGRNSNKSAIGTRVKVISGDLAQIREVSGGIGAGSQNSLPVEFGLGKTDFVDQVIIRWPSGIIQKFKKVLVDRLVIVEEPYQLGPVQLSSTSFKYFKAGFVISFGTGLLAVVVVYVLMPAIRHYASKRKVKIKRGIALPRLKKALPAKDRKVAIEEPEISKITVIPCLSVKVNLIHFREEYLLTHSVEPKSKVLRAFRYGREEKAPYPIKEIKIQRLIQKIEQLWQCYAQYISSKKESPIKPLPLLQEIGNTIYNHFGLIGLLNKLFSLREKEDLHLNFVIDNALIPWHWAYHSSQHQFLFERFPYSVSFTIGLTNDNTDRKMRGTKESLASPSAILLYGDWKGHHKELKQVASEVHEIGQIIQKQGAQVYSIYQDSDRFAETIHQRGENLRLIHYSGHIEQNTLDLGEDEFLAVDFLKQAYGLTLASQPVVFLNGCRSGQLENLWQEQDNLATGFLDCGASACIVTHFQIPELSAKNFALRFYHHFINRKLTVARALQQARLDLAKPEFSGGTNPEYDITRFFYNLYGDPTVKF